MRHVIFIPTLLLAMLVACQKQNPQPFAFEETTISALQDGYKSGKFTVTDVVKAYLHRIEAIDKSGPSLNSIIVVNPDALTIAAELDRELTAGKPRGPMHGIPVVLKDNIDTHDKMPTTAGSRALAGSHPLQDSWVAQKLRDAGAVILAKANLSEWANFRGDISSSGWSGVGGQTRNPYVLDRNPCGSSSGSGAAVSANLCMVAIGTETNGSIVCPSTANGIVGIKPTVGLWSRSGIVPISYTQDTPGPMARTLRDAATCLGVVTGIDPRDDKTGASKGKSHTDYTQFLVEGKLKGKRLGLYKGAMGFHWKVDALIQAAVEHMQNQGAEIIELEEIVQPGNGANSFQVMLYEFKDGLNKYFASLGDNAPVKSLQELIEFNMKDPVELRYHDQNLLIKAQEKAGLDDPVYKKALADMFKATRGEGLDKVMNEHKLDAIIAPTGSPAWLIDPIDGDNFLGSSSSPAARAGYPNITVPMGYIDGLPVGINFFGRAWSEPLLLEIAYSYEQSTKHRRAPAFKESLGLNP